MIYAGQPDKQRKTLVDWDPLSFSNPQSNLNLSHSCSVLLFVTLSSPSWKYISLPVILKRHLKSIFFNENDEQSQ